MKITRRAFLAGTTTLGVLTGCNLLPGQTITPGQIPPNLTDAKKNFTFAISPGNQSLWRYIAANNDRLLKSAGYDVTFKNVETPEELEKGYINNTYDAIVIPATLVPRLSEQGADAQFFLPIAWIRQGYVLAVGTNSPIKSVAELRGKRIAGPPAADPAFAYWPAFTLKNYQFNLVKDATYTAIDDFVEIVNGIKEGRYDAGAFSGFSWATVNGSNERTNLRRISDLKEEWDKASSKPKDSPRLLMLGGYVARPKLISENQRFIETFIKVHYDALKRYRTEAERAAMQTEIVNYTANQAPNIPLDVSTYLAWYLGMADTAPERVYLTKDDLTEYQLVYDLLKNSQYLANAPKSVDPLFYQPSFRRA